MIDLKSETHAMLSQLTAISLPDLQAEAAFLTRRDRKYLIPVAGLASLLQELDGSTRVLDIGGRRSFGYLTPYFDDDQYSAYMRAARRRPNRFKVRTRLYTDSGICMLELKVRDPRGMTVKHRIEHDSETLDRLHDEERNWLGAFPQVEPFAGEVRHRMTTFYRRTTLVLPDSMGRVTIDRDLTFELPEGSRIETPSFAIIETKSPGGPTSIDRLLWAHGHRPVSISKFAAGLSLLVPSLPSNRWHRLHAQLARGANESGL